MPHTLGSVIKRAESKRPDTTFGTFLEQPHLQTLAIITNGQTSDIFTCTKYITSDHISTKVDLFLRRSEFMVNPVCEGGAIGVSCLVPSAGSIRTEW